MKLTIDRKAFHTTLTSAALTAERSGAIPILQCARLCAADGSLNIETTDMDAISVASLAADVQAGGFACVRADDLCRIVGSLTTDTIEVERRADVLHIRGGRSHLRLGVLDEKQFPEIQKFTPDAEWVMPTGNLVSALRTVAPFQSTEETRYYLCGAHIAYCDGKLIFVATDGDGLALIEQEPPLGCDKMGANIIIPRNSVAKLLKIAIAETVRIAVNPAAMEFDFGTIRLRTKLVDGTFPDHRRILPAVEPGWEAKVNSDELSAALKTLAVASENGLLIRLSKNEMLIASEMGRADGETTVECDYSGSLREFGINRHTLNRTVQCAKVDTIRFWSDGNNIRYEAGELCGVMCRYRVGAIRKIAA